MPTGSNTLLSLWNTWTHTHTYKPRHMCVHLHPHTNVCARMLWNKNAQNIWFLKKLLTKLKVVPSTQKHKKRFYINIGLYDQQPHTHLTLTSTKIQRQRQGSGERTRSGIPISCRSNGICFPVSWVRVVPSNLTLAAYWDQEWRMDH